MLNPNYSTEKVEENATYGKFIISPLPKSFGHTFGFALRRTLLSSLEGAAITQVKIEGVPHLFTPISGVKESALELILNLKTVKFALPVNGQARVYLEKKGPGKIYSKDLEGEVKPIDENIYLSEITAEKGKLSLEAIVERGVGFLPAEQQEKKEFGFIPIDATFSPIVKVNYKVEEARVGTKTNFERLILEVWTNGGITPSDALKQAAKILSIHFDYLLSGKDAPKPKVDLITQQAQEKENSRFAEIIIDELNLPSRVINALLREKIETVADLMKVGKSKLVVMKGLGKKSIELIEEELKKLGVSLKEE
jgi:DNA-directed RNA polymerase subunit alpha